MAPKIGQSLGEPHAHLDIAHKGGLGDLEDQVGRLCPGRSQLTLDQGKYVKAAHGGGREICLHPPSPRGKTDGVDGNPTVDFSDETVLLGDRQEGTWQYDLTSPAHHTEQELLAGHFSGGRDNGL